MFSSFSKNIISVIELENNGIKVVIMQGGQSTAILILDRTVRASRERAQ